ncbi:TonB-dependent receptor plug domain-containing protein [Dyella psychrodurans]|uniref:TonB-dependent receptor n=1 Tax=Dyella psychrodurans TaxID=1927960 RepID=A0A370WVG2_9GAMM|nr:TonB-dependent receptor [Dyella psychrodurans]RDS80080.1 TonB-dependent receptor [Dyella psychrodurans]
MRQKNRIASAIAVALTICACNATAQDAAQAQSGQADAAKAKQMDAVVVTGSHIRSVDVETSQPVYTMDRKAIQATGLTNVSDILARMPSIGTPDITPQDTLSSGTDVGGRYVDIRNLGSMRTLVLVNGHRWSTSLSGLTDLSTIPVSLIDRIDVLKDGASSVYGSDAIGGVVNIVLRDHLDGAEFNAYYGQNEQGDGQQKNGDFTWGHTTKKSSFILSASYQDEQPMWDRTRAITAYPQGPRHPDAGWGTGPWGRVIDPNTGRSYVINRGNTDTANIANYHPYNSASTYDKYNSNQDMTFRAGTSLKNLFLQERYRLTDDITLHGAASYSSRNTSSQLAGYPFSWALDPDAYYNPFPGEETVFARRTVELPRVTWSNSRLTHLDAGAEGQFTFLSHDWNWDANYTFAQTRIRQISTGNLYLPHADNAINAIAGPNGQPVCADASDGCTPWNILAGPGATPTSVLNYVNYVGTARQMSQTDDASVNVGGGLFDIPKGGTVNIAGGLEHRREKGYFTPDPNDAAGLTTNLASEPTRGRYDVNEAYLELDAPLLRDLPGVQELGINLASRYSHYSSFGSTTNNKYSVRWRPIEDLLIRGTYAQGFRAPTLADLYSGTAQSFETFLDPCDSVYGAAASNPTVAARCVASGVPASYRQIDQSGNPITSSAGGQTPTPFADSSNPNLKPETSTTRTYGLVYSPHYAEGLDITLDYYDIRLKNAIASVDASDVLNYCYIENMPSYCSVFTRNGNGVITQLVEGLYNLGTLTTTGYDLGIHYRLPETSFGRFRISSDSTYLTKYQTTSGPGAVPEDVLGFMDGNQAMYRIRSNLQLDWDYRQFGASWTIRYYSGLKDSCYSVNPAIECSNPGYTNPWIGGFGIAQKGSLAFNDAQVRYTTPWKGVVTLGVNNIFNKKGPFYYNVVQSGTGSPPYGPDFDIDRFFYLQYSQKFSL